MIVRKLHLLIVVLSVFCLSCSDDSTSSENGAYKITKSKTKRDHYIPLNANNKYKYELIASKTNKLNNSAENYNKIIDVTMSGDYYYHINYAIDTNWANYFGREKYYGNMKNVSDVYNGLDENHLTFSFAIDWVGLVSKNLYIDKTYADTIEIDNNIYNCIVIEERKDGGKGRCITHYSKGIGAVKYRYKYADIYSEIVSDMILKSCDVK